VAALLGAGGSALLVASTYKRSFALLCIGTFLQVGRGAAVTAPGFVQTGGC
jgi:hypothetical protein